MKLSSGMPSNKNGVHPPYLLLLSRGLTGDIKHTRTIRDRGLRPGKADGKKEGVNGMHRNLGRDHVRSAFCVRSVGSPWLCGNPDSSLRESAY